MTRNIVLLKAGLLALGLQGGLQASASAGGFAAMTLPVEGLTAENGTQCLEILRSGLKENLGKHGSVKLTGKDSPDSVRLVLGMGQVSLDEIDAALKGSTFRINREQLELFGAVRLQLTGMKDVNGMSKELKGFPQSDTVLVSSRPAADGSVTFVVTDAARGDASLFSYRKLERILARQGARLVSLNWGISPAEGAESENMSFHCRAPYGARSLADPALAARP